MAVDSQRDARRFEWPKPRRLEHSEAKPGAGRERRDVHGDDDDAPAEHARVEIVLDLFEKISGNRNHYVMLKPGGVKRDIRESMYPEIVKGVDELLVALKMYLGAVSDDPVIHSRTIA